MTHAKQLALFDLDHTLLPLDSDYQWADYLARSGHAGDPEQAQRRNDELMHRYNRGELSAQEAAAFMFGLLAAADPVDLAAWHESYMREVVRPAILPPAIALVNEHLRQGDLCAIVTATNTFVTAPIARAFNVPHLIGTVPAWRAGRYTGAIEGVPSFKEGKVTRVNAWLDGLGLTLSGFERSYFYSDSMNDLPLLEAVTHPVATNPSPSLRQLADERGWPVLDLFGAAQDLKS
jgi:HAD superfamily hydrolase (TIGR01490 family)